MPSLVDPGLQVVFDEPRAAGRRCLTPADVGVAEGRAARERYYAYLNQPVGEIACTASTRRRLALSRSAGFSQPLRAAATLITELRVDFLRLTR